MQQKVPFYLDTVNFPVEIKCKNPDWQLHKFLIYIKYNYPEWSTDFESYFIHEEDDLDKQKSKFYYLNSHHISVYSGIEEYIDYTILKIKIFDFIDFENPDFNSLKNILEQREEKIIKENTIINQLKLKNDVALNIELFL